MQTDPATIEAEIYERMKAAKIRLRFDKVVVRLVSGLQSALADVVLDRQAVIFTMAAPIKNPAKTTAALQSAMTEGPRDVEREQIVHGNQTRIRWLADVPQHSPKVLGFVHDPTADAELILDLAAARLLARNGSGGDL